MELYKLCLLVIMLLLNSRVLCENGMILTSTLVSTSRDYACGNETVVITCSGGVGRELIWNYDDSQTQLEFIFDDNAGTLPQVMYNKPAGVIAYLTSRPSVGNGMFQYTSQLSIVKIIVDSMEVNCSVTSDPITMENLTVRTLSVRKSAVPDEPIVMSVDQLGCVGINENISQYLLKWMPPDNINDFDLSHYEVTVIGPSTNLTVGCIDTSTIFTLNLGATMDDTEDNATVNVSINVVAVNQCGQRGIATESTNGMVLPLRKCISNSSEVTLKISALLWAALLLIAMILPAP